MIVVVGIKTISVPQEVYRMAIPPHLPVLGFENGEQPCYATLSTEDIKGLPFWNTHGERVILGFAKNVQSVLGLPFEVFENLNEQLRDERLTYNRNVEVLVESNARLKKALRAFENPPPDPPTLWKRVLNCVFRKGGNS